MRQDSDKPRRRWGIDWLWLAGLALLLSLHFWFPPITSGPPQDTYSARAEGKKAFYRLAQRRFWGVARNTQSFDAFVRKLDENYETEAVLCLLGPARYPTPREWETLLDWVQSGGRLILAARAEDGELALEELNIQIAPLADAAADAGDESGPDQSPSSVTTTLLDEADLEWNSNQAVLGGTTTLVSSRGTQQAVRQTYGNGQIVIVATDDIFSNASLGVGDNSVLAFRLLEAAGAIDTVYFDESLNASGTPKVVGLLLEPFLRPVTVQLLVALWVFGWWRSRRFGPLLPRSVTARRNIVDHTDTVGILHYKARGGAVAVRSYLQQLVMELRLKYFKGHEERVLEPLAGRLGTDVGELKQWLDRAEAASRVDNPDRREAGEIIRKLAEIRWAARIQNTGTAGKAEP